MLLTHPRVGGHGFPNPCIGDVYRLAFQSRDGKKQYAAFGMKEFSHEFTHFSYRRAALNRRGSIPSVIVKIEDADGHDPEMNPDLDINSVSSRSAHLHPASPSLPSMSEASVPSHVSVNVIDETGIVRLDSGSHADATTLKRHRSVLNRVPHYIEPFTVGAIIRDFGTRSFTGRLRDLIAEARRHHNAEASNIDVVVRGPFRRVHSRLMTAPQNHPYLIMTSGSGISLVLDYIFWVRDDPRRMRREVKIVTTTRDAGLFQLVTDLLREEAGTLPLLSADVYLTTPDVIASSPSVAVKSGKIRAIHINVGRCDVEDVVRKALPNTEAFVIGKTSFSKEIVKHCWDYGVDVNYEESF
jgi:hypothetical protein